MHLQGSSPHSPFLETIRRAQLFRVMYFQANLKELFGLFDFPVGVKNGSLVRMVRDRAVELRPIALAFLDEWTRAKYGRISFSADVTAIYCVLFADCPRSWR